MQVNLQTTKKRQIKRLKLIKKVETFGRKEKI